MADRTSVKSGLWSDPSTWNTGVPADGDYVYIESGCSVQFDVNQSAFTGLYEIKINTTDDENVPPGMLYVKYVPSGNFVLKIRTGYNSILGEAYVYEPGRLLANYSGDWEDNTPLPHDCKFTINMQGTSYISNARIDVKLLCDEPQHKYVHTYGVRYGPINQSTGINLENGTIDLGMAAPTANTEVRVMSDGELPSGLYQYATYFVHNPIATTCQLKTSTIATESYIIKPESLGSGSMYLYTGYNSGSATVNTVEDISSDKWDIGNYVTLCNLNSTNRDIQKLTLSNKTSSTAVLSTTVDSAQKPLSLLALSSRNIIIINNDNTGDLYQLAYGNDTYNIQYYPAMISIGGTNTIGYNAGFQGVGKFRASVISWFETGAMYCGEFFWSTDIIDPSGTPIYDNIIGMSLAGILDGKDVNVNNVIGCGCGLLYENNNQLASIAEVQNILGCSSGILFSLLNAENISKKISINIDNIISCNTAISSRAGLYIDSNINVNKITNTNIGLHNVRGGVNVDNLINIVDVARDSKDFNINNINNCQYVANNCRNFNIDFAKYVSKDLFVACTNPNIKNGYIKTGLSYCDGNMYDVNLHDLETISSTISSSFLNINDIIGYELFLGTDLQYGSTTPLYTRSKYKTIIYDPKNESLIPQRGRILGWCGGGRIISEEESVPSGSPVLLDWCNTFVFESGNIGRNVRNSGLTVSCDLPTKMKPEIKNTIPIYLKCNIEPSGMETYPRIDLYDKNNQSVVYSGHVSNTIDWQTVNIEYTPDYEFNGFIRIEAGNMSGVMYWWSDPNNHPVLPNTNTVKKDVEYGYYSGEKTGTLQPEAKNIFLMKKG